MAILGIVSSYLPLDSRTDLDHGIQKSKSMWAAESQICISDSMKKAISKGELFGTLSGRVIQTEPQSKTVAEYSYAKERAEHRQLRDRRGAHDLVLLCQLPHGHRAAGTIMESPG